MNTLIGLQYLRGFAASLVAVYHLIPKLLGPQTPEPFWLGVMAGGVDVFFVISGFIIWLTASRATVSPGEWWKSRLIRIVPMYWLALIVTLVLILVRGTPDAYPYPSEVIRAFLFIPVRSHITGGFEPYFTPGWSLNYEFLFYAVVALTLFLRRPLVRLAVIAVFFTALVACRKFINPEDAIQFRLTSPLYFEFLAGIAISLALPKLRQYRFMPVLGALAVVASVAFCLFISPRLYPNSARIVFFGVPAILLTAGVVMLEPLWKRWPVAALKLIGDASYSIYLSHSLFINLVFAALGSFVTAQPVIGSLVTMVAIYAGGIAVYHLIEKPLLNAMRSATGVGRLQQKASA